MNELEHYIQPQDLKAEESLISSILLDRDVMEEITVYITPDDFYKISHGIIYSAALELYSKNDPIDLITVVNKLKEIGKLEIVGGATALAKIIDTVPIAVNAIHYSSIIKEKSILRKLISEANSIARNCYQNKNVNEILERADKAINLLSDNQNIQDEIESNSSIANDFLQEIEKNKDSGGVTGLLTGINRLDYMLGGLQPSDLIVLAARPSMGKSSLCINIAKKVSDDNGHTLIMSYETKRKKICARIVSNVTKINSRRFRTGKFSTKEWKNINNASSYFSEMNITIDDTGKKNVAEMRRLAFKINKEKKLKLIVIDYLGRMPMPKADRHDLAIGAITSGLKGLSNEMDIPIILLSQLNRKLEDRDNKRPKMSDLRDSGSIEQDADVVIFLYRETVYKEEADPLEAEIIIAKNRDGEIGMVKAKYEKELTTFSDYIISS